MYQKWTRCQSIPMKKSAALLIGDSRAARMTFKRSFADLHRIFALVSIKKRIAMVLGLFVLSFVDLMGLAMLVPFLAMATTNGNVANKSLNNIIRHSFEIVGLPHTIKSVLAAFAALILAKSVISIALMSFSASSVAAVTQKVRLRLARSLLFVRWPYLAHARVGEDRKSTRLNS